MAPLGNASILKYLTKTDKRVYNEGRELKTGSKAQEIVSSKNDIC